MKNLYRLYAFVFVLIFANTPPILNNCIFAATRYTKDQLSNTSSDNVTAELSDEGVLTIKGSGAMKNFTSASAPWYSIRTTIKKISIGNDITSIGNYAFQSCTNCTTLEISQRNSKLSSVGSYAFNGCSKLTDIKFPAISSIGTYAFQGCSNLENFYLSPKSTITTYPAYMLSGCTSLKCVNIPPKVTTIGNYAFNNCSALVCIYSLPIEAPKTIGTGAFTNVPVSVAIRVLNSATVTNYKAASTWSNYTDIKYFSSSTWTMNTYHIGSMILADRDDDNFKVYVSLKANSNKTPSGSVTLPNNLYAISGLFYDYDLIGKEVEAEGYKDLTGITSLTIGNTYTKIGNLAFSGCTSLATVTIGQQMVSIESNAFKDCNLTNVTWNALNYPNFTSSSSSPFYNRRTSITTFSISTSIQNIPSYLCYGMTELNGTRTFNSFLKSIGNHAFYNCTNLTGLNFNSASNLTSIGSNAFYNCNQVTSDIKLPASLTELGICAFQSCKKIKSLTFADGINLTSIPNNCFQHCNAISGTIEIPSSITSIGNYAFQNCSTVVAINLMKAQKLETIGNYAFSGMSEVAGELYIPSTVTSIGTYALQNMTSLEAIVAMKSMTTEAMTPPTASASTFSGIKTDEVILYLPYSANTTTLDRTYKKYSEAEGWELFFPNGSRDNVKTDTDPQQCGDNLYWQFRFSTNRVIFSGSGDMWNYNNSTNKAPWRKYVDILHYIDFCNDITSIGDYAFYGCSNYKSSGSVRANVEKIGQYAFYNCSSLQSLSFAQDSKLSELGDNAFRGCSSIKSAVLPSNLTAIPNYAFYGCSAITKLTLPENLQTIGTYAFYNCLSLSNICLPATVTSLGTYAFSGCSAVEYIKSDNPSPASANNNSFNNINKTTTYLCVPEGSEEAYCAANGWKDFCGMSGQTIGGVCGDNAKWKLDFSTGKLIIYGTGRMTNSYSPWEDYKASIKSIIIEEGITSVGTSCFSSTPAKIISLPSTITAINESAFSNCTAIDTLWVGFDLSTTVSMPQTQTGYSSYTNKQFDNVPVDIVIAVPNGAQTNFQSAIVWKNFTNYHVWGYCGADTDNKNVIWLLSLNTGKMKYIGSGNIKNYGSDKHPWYSLKGIITTADFSEGITSTGAWGLYECTNLAEVTLPSTLTEISVRTFSKTAINSITIPNKVTTIGNYAFENCDQLNYFNWDGTLVNWLGVKLGNSSSTPSYCSKNIFIQGELLENLVIPNSINVIMANHFYNCQNIKTLTLHESVLTVEESAFYGCTNISQITSWRETPPAISNANAWTNVPATTPIYVPCADAEEAYKAQANWARFTGEWHHLYDFCEKEWVIDSDKTISEDLQLGFSGDIVVRSGATLTLDEPANLRLNINDIRLEPNARVEVTSGATYAIRNLIMEREQDEVATAAIQGSMSAQNLILDFALDNTRWYGFSLPQTLAPSSVKFANGSAANYRTDWFAMYYDGEARAQNGVSAVSNWKEEVSSPLAANKGYIIGLSDDIPSATLRFVMPNPALAEQASNQTLYVNQYPADKWYNAGWNLVGNPYLQAYHNQNLSMQVEDDELLSMMTFTANGEFFNYHQALVSDIVLQPFSAVFLQAPTTGELLFEAASARRGMKAKTNSRSILNLQLVNSSNEQDKTIFVVGDYTSDFKIGTDMPKWFNDGYQNQSAPTLFSEKAGSQMAIQSFNSAQEQVIPLGCYLPAEGTYTFRSLTDNDEFEHIYLYDEAENITTDLTVSDYSFAAARQAINNRFYLTVEMAKDDEGDEENNPATGFDAATSYPIFISGLDIRLKDLYNTQVAVYDMSGKLISQQQTNGNYCLTLPQSGIYLLRLSSEDESQTMKIVVK